MLFRSRLAVVGTTAQVRGDFGTQPLAGSGLGMSLLWLAVVVAVTLAWTLAALRPMAERPAAEPGPVGSTRRTAP